jgi:hypothetical protein
MSNQRSFKFESFRFTAFVPKKIEYIRFCNKILDRNKTFSISTRKFRFKRFCSACVAGGSSFANLQQREAIIGSPPLLDEIWRTQGTQKQSRTTEIGPSFFFMMFISFAVKIHRSTITTVARPQLTGSGEPVTRAK